MVVGSQPANGRVLIVQVVFDGDQVKAFLGELVEFGCGQWPRHGAGRIQLTAATRHHQQPAAGSDQFGQATDCLPAHVADQDLQGVGLEDEREGVPPVRQRRQQVGDLIADR